MEEDNMDVDIPTFIIVLGNPNPVYYKERVDRAMKMFETKKCWVIMTGHKGESTAMKKYALEKYGEKNDSYIIEEKKSTNTLQNLLFTKEIIENEKKIHSYSVIVCTSTFHINRSLLLTHFVFRNGRNVRSIQSIHSNTPIPEDRRIREKMLLDNLLTFIMDNHKATIK